VVGFKKPSFGVIHALYSRAFFGSRASSARPPTTLSQDRQHLEGFSLWLF